MSVQGTGGATFVVISGGFFFTNYSALRISLNLADWTNAVRGRHVVTLRTGQMPKRSGMRACWSTHLTKFERLNPLTGGLLWLCTRTRPGVAFGAIGVASYCARDPERSLAVEKKLLRYLSGGEIWSSTCANSGSGSGCVRRHFV